MQKSAREAAQILPVGGAALSLGVLATHLHAVASQLAWNGDVSSRYVLGETLRQNGPRGRVFTTQLAYAWVNAATQWLPAHRVVWEAYPFVAMTLALGVLGATLWHLTDRRTALLGVVLGLAATPAVLVSEVAQAFHGFAYAATIVLDAILVMLAGAPRARLGWLLVGAGTLVTGAVAMTDPLLLVIGVVPAGIASIVTFVRHRDPVPMWNTMTGGVAMSVGAGVVAVAGLVILRHTGFEDLIPGGTHRRIASPGALVDHVKAAGLGVLDLTAGLPFTSSSIVVWRAVVGTLFALGFTAASVAGVARVLRRGDSPARTVHVTFWTASAVTLLAAFVASDIVPGGVVLEPSTRLLASVRYLVPLFFVGIALLPIWVEQRPRRRTLAGAGVAGFAVWSAFAVVSATDARAFQPQSTLQLPAVVRTLEARGLNRGYGSYWDSSALIWASNDRLAVFPAGQDAECGSPSTSGALCAWSFNSESSWFIPRRHATTFILIDPESNTLTSTPSRAIFGEPADALAIGDIQVYVYSYDVATRFLSTCAGRDDHGC